MEIEIKMAADVKVLSPKPGDVVVFRIDTHLSAQTFMQVKSQIEPLFPNNKIMILEEGTGVEIIESDSDGEKERILGIVREAMQKGTFIK